MVGRDYTGGDLFVWVLQLLWEGGWWCFSLPDRWPPSPSPSLERSASCGVVLHSSLSLSLSDINHHITNTSHARWLSVWCDANLIWIWIRSRRLCVAPAVSPLWSDIVYLVQNCFVAVRLTWIGMVKTPKWEVKCFERFLQTPEVGKPNEFVRDRIKKVFFTKILFSLEKLVSSNN